MRVTWNHHHPPATPHLRQLPTRCLKPDPARSEGNPRACQPQSPPLFPGAKGTQKSRPGAVGDLRFWGFCWRRRPQGVCSTVKGVQSCYPGPGHPVLGARTQAHRLLLGGTHGGPSLGPHVPPGVASGALATVTVLLAGLWVSPIPTPHS